MLSSPIEGTLTLTKTLSQRERAREVSLLLPLKQELHNLRHYVTGPLVQFVLREVSNRMFHTQIFIVG